jgi:hypothetical protein
MDGGEQVLLYMGLVSLSSAQDLREQLQQALGSGLHVVCATSLPQGAHALPFQPLPPVFSLSLCDVWCVCGV